MNLVIPSSWSLGAGDGGRGEKKKGQAKGEDSRNTERGRRKRKNKRGEGQSLIRLLSISGRFQAGELNGYAVMLSLRALNSAFHKLYPNRFTHERINFIKH